MEHEKRNVKPHIPEGGTLGILADGYRGVMMWRQERNRILVERMKKLNKKTPSDEKE